jgi:hypothetical protein
MSDDDDDGPIRGSALDSEDEDRADCGSEDSRSGTDSAVESVEDWDDVEVLAAVSKVHKAKQPIQTAVKTQKVTSVSVGKKNVRSRRTDVESDSDEDQRKCIHFNTELFL